MDEAALGYGAELAYSAEEDGPEPTPYVPDIGGGTGAVAVRAPRMLLRSANLLAAAVVGAAAVAILWAPPDESAGVRIGPHTGPIPVAPPAASAAPPPPAAAVPPLSTKTPVRQPAARVPANPPQPAPVPKAEQLNKALNDAGLKGPGIPERDAEVAQEVCRRLAHGSSPQQILTDLGDGNPNFTPQQVDIAFQKSREIYCP
ncbi:DUF732 domain-containing protein [Mycolicibacter senuensis]|nr:DUF732 domain-containing protein [Mycolicibacter senuensis]MDQ2629003.1 DUF732 domain-containing protein [Actinomycetota bacterium]ORW66395.1 hypothetical protein AWC24_15390 [Mycolicibacter senuensis]